jgi:hypothetical protein
VGIPKKIVQTHESILHGYNKQIKTKILGVPKTDGQNMWVYQTRLDKILGIPNIFVTVTQIEKQVSLHICFLLTFN